MHLDEWVRIVKNIGPTRFKDIGTAFLRERFGRPVQYADGTGDGGVDAWVILSDEPRVWRAAQFYGGEGDWAKKLEEDVGKLAEFRSRVAEDRRSDFETLYFVCGQQPSATTFEVVASELRRRHGVVVTCFDARAIAGQASQRKTSSLMALLARELSVSGTDAPRPKTARDEALLTFALFHESPNKFRWAVTKAAISTVLHRHSGHCEDDTLRREVAELLGVSQDSRLIERALRNLRSEGLVSIDGSATEELRSLTQTTLIVAAAERQKLVDDCATDLAPFCPKGTRGRDRAKRIADSVVDDLGHLVRSGVADRALRAAEPRASTREEEVTRTRLRTLRDRLAVDLSEDDVENAVRVLLERAAIDPFARRLAAAELFARLTEIDATELAQALGVPRLRVMLDASIAMPIVCAKYDRVAMTLPASVEADALHRALLERGATMILPAPYLEELAAHLLKAGEYASVIGNDPALARSKNYFVAHFCCTHDPEYQTGEAFLDVLRAFGASAPAGGDWRTRRIHAERELRRILTRYEIIVTDLDERGADRELPDEPPRPPVVLRHDRVVVSALTEANAEPTILCTADVWLQGVCAAFEVTALDGGALADLLALVTPAGTERPLVSLLALTFGSDQDVAAAEVWDAVVDVEGEHLDWKLVQRAKAFRDDWLTRRRAAGHDAHADTIREAWKAFRDEAG